jgi:TonB family protein
MKRRYFRSIALSLALGALAVGLPVRAQPGAGSGNVAAAQDAVSPPRLLAFVDAGYPEAARAAPRTASVLLALTIDTDGFVENAELVGPAEGDGFDQLALSAARRFVFEPATRGGEPMRARVQFRYDFALPQAPEENPKPAPPGPSVPRPGGLELSLRDQATDAPLAEVEILLTSPEDPAFGMRAVSDPAGNASFTGLLPRHYTLALTKPEYGTEDRAENVTANEITSVTYRLTSKIVLGGYGAYARVTAPPREVTRRSIEREELTRVAGTRGDALRTIELLPGVSRPPFGSGQVLIRGSAPGDSQVFLNGVPVPLLYHFGGLTSFINSRALERIDFYPGNFSVKYGRQIGGVIDVGVRDPATDSLHGVIDANLPLDSSLLVEGPIGKNASFLVGARRSYFGELISATVPRGTFDAFAAPYYYDYQGIVTYRPTERDKLRIALYGSNDRLKVLFNDVPDDDPSITGIEVSQSFHRQQIGWNHRYSSRFDHSIEVSFGKILLDFSAGRDIRFRLDDNNVYARAEFRYRFNEALQITYGTDTFVDKFKVRFQGPPVPQGEGDNSSASLGDRPTVQVRSNEASTAPALYSELAIQPSNRWRIVPGLRLDYFSTIGRFAFDPRVAGFYSVTDKTKLKAGVGVFSQQPKPQETAPLIGNDNLRPIRAVHYGAGVDHSFTEDLSVGFEGFYKQIRQRVVSNDENGPSAHPFNNDGIGRIYGLEVAGRKKASGRWFGFLSYTLMRSQRRDHPGERWYLFDFDQTHIFTLAGTVVLGRGFEAGGVGRLISGNPYTPIIGGLQSLNSGNFTALTGVQNSVRNPMFRRLDLRIEKKWTFAAWRLAAYLDVQNVFNAKNPEGISYNFNYKERSQVRGLIIIPIIGLRGEL